MDFKVKLQLECDPSCPADFLFHQSALMASLMMYKSYKDAKDIILGTGPELFAEQWVKTNLACPTREFEDLVVKYFIKILRGVEDGE